MNRCVGGHTTGPAGVVAVTERGEEMNALALVGAALPIAATYLLLEPVRRAGASRVCASALAVGVGLGIASCTFFLALVLFDGRRAGVLGIDAAFTAFALAVWWRSDTQPVKSRAPFSPGERILALALLGAAIAGATSFLANTLDEPHGRWDAWATWNLRARWLADSGPAWRLSVAKPAIHGDYPLLLPSTVARLWVYGGSNDPVVPAAVAAAYAAALVLLLHAVLATLRGRTQAFIGALCLLGTPLFLRVVPWQYADAPLAFNLLAAVSLFSLYDRDPPRGRVLLAWAGVATGLALWTKNEGMMLALGIVLVRGIRMIFRRGPRLRDAASFVAGLLPPAAIAAYFKLTMAPRSPQFGEKGGAMIAKLTDAGRYVAVLRAAGHELLRGTGPVLIGLVVYAILLGRTRDRGARGTAAGVASIVGFAALGYTVTCVLTRAELTWLLGHSMDRLVFQLWPSVLLAVLLYVGSPPERDAATPVRPSAGRPPAKPVSRRRAGRR